MNSEQLRIVETIAQVLRLEPSRMTLAGQEVLVLSRAACQLHYQLTVASVEDERADALRLRWLRIADPTANADALRALERGFASSTDTTWLKGWPVEEQQGTVLILGLLILISEGRGAAPGAWGILDQCARVLDVDDQIVHLLWGWLNGTADAGQMVIAEGMLEAMGADAGIASGLITAARTDRGRRRSHAPDSNYFSLRDRVRSLTLQAGEVLNAMQVPTVRDEALLRYLENDAFRITVLGEFKRGKSTFINALVGSPELLPVGHLPCTSGVIEIHPGPHRAYFRREDPFADWSATTAHDLKQNGGDAAQRRSRRTGSEQKDSHVVYWRINLPEASFAAHNVCLVDTPGLGEDAARDRIARAEADRVDASIMVLSAQQLVTSLEITFLERLRTKAEDVFVVINYADMKPESDWDLLLEQVVRRFSEDEIFIPRDRIAMISASKALAEYNAGARGEWSARLANFWANLIAHVQRRGSAARRERLSEAVRSFVEEADTGIKQRIEIARRTRDQVEDVAADYSAKLAREKAAKGSLDGAVETMRYHHRAGLAFAEAFESELPRMVERLNKVRDTWRSEFNPVVSPRKFAEDVGRQARDCLLLDVERWIKDTGTPLLQAHVEDTARRAARQLDEFSQYISDSTGKSVDDVWNEVRFDALRYAFPDAVGAVDTSTVIMGNVVAGVVSVIVGYIIADIVLFYLLSAISGFLNPALLVAAALLGIAAYLFKGRSFVEGMVRTRIADKIGSELLVEAGKAKIRIALKKAVQELYERQAAGLERAGQDLLREVGYQQREAADRIREAEGRLGRIEALKDELARLERLSAEGRNLLSRLKAAIE
jgi:hypothetical protein